MIYHNDHIYYFIYNEFVGPLVSVYVKTIDLYLEVDLTGLKIQEISEEKIYIIVHIPYGLPLLCYTSDLKKKNICFEDQICMIAWFWPLGLETVYAIS